MKKVVFFVVVLLIGGTTQAFSTNQLSVDQNPGIQHRYNKSQSIRFVENGVLYRVYTNGNFDYTVINPARRYRQGRRQNVSFGHNAPGAVHYTRPRRGFRPIVQTDGFGNIISIGSTWITYKRNGRVKRIGSIVMRYDRGWLTQVGNMQIVYGRNGNIVRTIGHVNRFNRKVWHDDWYIDNDCDFGNDYWDDDWNDNFRDEDFFEDRRRTKRNRKK